MNRQHPTAIVMATWKQIDTSPWITLKAAASLIPGYSLRFEMQHSKTGKQEVVQLESQDIYRIDDPWTHRYIFKQLAIAHAALTRNTAEAGVGSIDVYREDYPA